MNSGFSIYYIEAMIACIFFFGILLLSNRFNMDRQEKQIKFDRALIVFMLYFLADAFWAAIVDGLIPKTRMAVVIDTFALYFFMTGIVYFWLEYVMAVEQAPHRNRPINRFATLFPFLVLTTVLIAIYLVSPQKIFTETLDAQILFNIFLMLNPIIYLVAILFYTMGKARRAENPAEKRKHLFIGFFPLVALVVGLGQTMLFPDIPIYCFVDSLLMMVFYIQSIQTQISIDPLTTLNNRGQLMRYISQKSNLYQEDRRTIVIMMDIDSFKAINDTYGHAEGDRALVISAEALKKVASGLGMPSFLCRYGGDEFILIVHPRSDEAVDHLISKLRDDIDRSVETEEAPYPLSISAGFDELAGEHEPIQDCIRRADDKLYQNKKQRKLQKAQNS